MCLFAKHIQKNFSPLRILQILEEKHNCKGIIEEVKQYGYTFNNE